MPKLQSAQATEYLEVGPIAATQLDGTPYVLSGFPVNIAFMAPDGEPGAGDWVAAFWTTKTAGLFATVLLGPAGGHVLPGPNEYYLHVQVAGSPEVGVSPGAVDILTLV